MQELMELLDDEEFADFVLHEYFKNECKSDEDKLNEVCSSLYDYKEAMECFKPSLRQ